MSEKLAGAPRRRTLAAWDFNETQPVPYTIWYDHDTMVRLNAHYGGTDWQRRIENHILRVTVDWEPRFDVDRDDFKATGGTCACGAAWARPRRSAPRSGA